MKTRAFLTVLLLTGFFSGISNRITAQTTLSPGDLSFVGFNSALNYRDGFAFVLWVPVSSGTTIKFTDNGFNSTSSSSTAGNLRQQEQTITWTSGTAIAAGTVITIEANGSSSTALTSCNYGTVSVQSSIGSTINQFNGLSSTGDNFFAFQGYYSFDNSATGTLSGTALFLIGFQGTGPNTAFVTSGSITAVNSYLPSDLGSYNLFFTSTTVAAEYTGARTGLTIAQYKAAVNNAANWTTYNNTSGVTAYNTTSFSASVAPSISAHPSNRTICAAANTTMSVTASGSPSYQWQVNTGSGYTNLSNTSPYSGATTSTLTFTGVTAGMSGYQYRCVATNASGSATSNAATLTVSNPAAATIQTNVSCNGGSNGSASVIASGGVSPYTYSWTPSGGTAATATGLSAGTYWCTITDNIGCTVTKTFSVTQPASLLVSPISQTNIACNGGSSGAAQVIATGGTPGYTYDWTPGTPTGDGTSSVTGLTAGTWTCTVTDANGCTRTRNFTITQPTAISASTSQTNVSCYGGATGVATVTATGGSSPYTYSWSPSGGTSATASGLSAGTYTCTITDANGCQLNRSFTITAPSSSPGQDVYSLPTSNQTFTRTVDNANFVSGTCELVNSVVASGANPVSGSVTHKVWIESSVPTHSSAPFVQRHYEITPSVSPNTATGTVTLYFTQTEFDNFNAHSGSVLNLPTGSGDAAGKANLRIGKYSGTSGNGTGLPASYSSSTLVIDPADNDIVWNANASCWEVSFTVSGFSGFIVQTSASTLPVNWASFTAHKQDQQVQLNWATASEQNNHLFRVQHSTNGNDWSTAGTVAAAGNSITLKNYSFVHTSPAKGNNHYRIVQVDHDGQSSYSEVKTVQFNDAFASFTVLANPVKNGMLQVAVTKPTILSLYSAAGKLLMKKQFTPGRQTISMNRYGAGVYYLQNEEGTEKIVVQ